MPANKSTKNTVAKSIFPDFSVSSPAPLSQLFSLLSFWLAIEILNFLIVPIVYFSEEAKEYFDDEETWVKKIVFFFRLVIAFIYNSITYMVAQVFGFFTWFKPQNNWKKTVHTASFDRK